ncbi:MULTISPECIES: 7-cyano-7-deazaguanine synthase [unclassified Mesorhizobium]|uniref:7-cyano-7-deazaguanine synthase n=1 Tax=unclassified Mesorhizobium TaxID=325217 RepID=UPI0003CF8911|nr:ExsB family transcriptional regulator [Mesorhizobium sp. LNJC374B00]ESY56811.1 ExsB family transcriptional regulator [Mesorhizobium sp. LNJC372A00]
MRDAVCLASGGLDSNTCLYLLKQNGFEPLPLFIDYGQINAAREFDSLVMACADLALGAPLKLDFSSFGHHVKSGLTDPSLHISRDAFTPCRNLLFIVSAAAVASSRGISKIVLGLLSEETILFPDQSDKFLQSASGAIEAALGVTMEILTPLRDYRKKDVLKLADRLGVKSYYSCHAGTIPPCGKCIACKEYEET